MPKYEGLSPRRAEAQRLKSEGLKPSEIATRMGISCQHAWVLLLPEEKYRKVLNRSATWNRNQRPKSALLGVSEAATILRIHPVTLRRWCNEGKIKATRSGPLGNMYFSREDIEAYISKHKH